MIYIGELGYHLYADDTQLYISFSTTSLCEMMTAKSKVEACVKDIDLWMVTNKLKLNGDKTFYHLPRHETLGSFLTKRFLITAVCKSCFFHIHNIWKIRKWLSVSACETLVHAFYLFKTIFLLFFFALWSS